MVLACFGPEEARTLTSQKLGRRLVLLVGNIDFLKDLSSSMTGLEKLSNRRHRLGDCRNRDAGFAIGSCDRLTPPETKMDTQNDGLEKVAPFKYGHFGYPC